MNVRETTSRDFISALAEDPACPIMFLYDAAANLAAPEQLQSLNGEQIALWSGELDDEMQAVAPRLVLLQPGSPAFKWAIEDVWTDAFGAVIRAQPDKTLDDIRRQLRRLGVVELPGGKPVHFRYYDPGVFASFLKVATPAQAKEVFGPHIRSISVRTGRDRTMSFEG